MRVNYNLVRWKQTPCLKYSTPLCYTTRWALTREALLSSHTNDFVVGPFPNVCWPSKIQTSMQKICAGNTIKTMHLIMFSPFVLRDFNHRNFPSAILCFYNYFHLANCHGHLIWDAVPCRIMASNHSAYISLVLESSCWPLLWLSSWCPIFKYSIGNSFEKWEPVNFMCRCPVFKWVAQTWQHCKVQG